MKTWLYPLIALTLLFMGCGSPQKYYQRGQYGRAVDKALERVRKGKADDRDIHALANAFNQLNGRDIDRVEGLLRDRNPDRWDGIIEAAERIRDRQELVRPYTPIRMPRTGQQVNLVTYDVSELLPKARQEAAEWNYREGMVAMENARKGDKRAAREAWTRFTRVSTYMSGYPNIRELIAEAEYLGYTQLQVIVENRTPTLMPGSFRNLLEETFRREVGQDWLNVILDERECRECDYSARIIIHSVTVSPDGIQESRKVEKAVVDDGFTYVLDGRGNVMKDTSGNDIKVPKTKEVIAEIFETNQFKAGRIEGSLEITRLATREVVRRIPLAGETQFRTTSLWFQGDERALTEKTRKALKGHPVPYPTADQILSDAADLFRGEVGRAIRQEKRVFLP